MLHVLSAIRSIASVEPMRPITGTNWDGTGVTPDIATTPDQALAVAENLMRRRLQGNAALVAAAQ